jgi:RimJ/RimL family protein N-acetyltransferase
VRLEFIDELEAFAALAWPLLIADEANHTILLSVIQGARRSTEAGTPDPGITPWHSLVVRNGESVMAAACRSRGNWLLSTGPAAACEAIGTALRTDADFRGMVGPEPSVRAAAETCGAALHLHTALPLMRLQGIPDPGTPAAPGRLEPMPMGVNDDLRQLLVAWLLAFRDEVRLADPREQVERDVAVRLTRGTLYVWFDRTDTPVCVLGAGPIAPSGARIGPVYTPPAQRGRGYARAAVTAASRLLLERGARTVFLFTDAANPTSNALYMKIGFVPVGRHLHLERESAELA